MVAPLMLFTNCCCEKVPKMSDKGEKANLGDKIVYSVIAFDTLLSISALVIGILGATSVIAMPAAAAYGLIGLSGGITLLWIGAIVKVFTCSEKQFPCFKPKSNYSRLD